MEWEGAIIGRNAFSEMRKTTVSWSLRVIPLDWGQRVF